MSTRQTA
jgi:ammonia channel protein AmtB